MASQIQLGLPDFSGATRKLVLWNVGAYFALLLATTAGLVGIGPVLAHLGLFPPNVLRGELWQVVTYSFVHPGFRGALWDLLSLWMIGGLLESYHGGRWLNGLYAASVLGTAVAALGLYAAGATGGGAGAVTGCLGGTFGLLVAVGLLHGDLEFLLLFVVRVKAKYLATIYVLVVLAMLFGEQKFYAFAWLGGAAGGWLWVKFAPRRGLGWSVSESWYGVRNRYYRWKRRRAAAKFQVYMRKQGRTMRFDGHGHLIDEDQYDPNDPTKWN